MSKPKPEMWWCIIFEPMDVLLPHTARKTLTETEDAFRHFLGIGKRTPLPEGAKYTNINVERTFPR